MPNDSHFLCLDVLDFLCKLLFTMLYTGNNKLREIMLKKQKCWRNLADPAIQAYCLPGQHVSVHIPDRGREAVKRTSRGSVNQRYPSQIWERKRRSWWRSAEKYPCRVFSFSLELALREIPFAECVYIVLPLRITNPLFIMEPVEHTKECSRSHLYPCCI